jgi:site-specific recombinase XerD
MILLFAIFSFAIQRGLRADNPCAGVRRYQPGKSERFLSPTEQMSLGEALAAAERAGTNPNAIAVIRVLALTGARAGEVLSLRWREVDLERTCPRLSDSKTGVKVIPLGAGAMQVIAAQERREGTDYVFPGAHGGPLGSIGKVASSAGRGGARRSAAARSQTFFSSNIVNGGGSLRVIGALLGHRSTQRRAHYAHLADDPLRDLANRAASRIATAMKGSAEGDAKVTPLRRGRRLRAIVSRRDRRSRSLRGALPAGSVYSGGRSRGLPPEPEIPSGLHCKLLEQLRAFFESCRGAKLAREGRIAPLQ